MRRLRGLFYMHRAAEGSLPGELAPSYQLLLTTPIYDWCEWARRPGNGTQRFERLVSLPTGNEETTHCLLPLVSCLPLNANAQYYGCNCAAPGEDAQLSATEDF